MKIIIKSNKVDRHLFTYWATVTKKQMVREQNVLQEIEFDTY